MTGKPRIEHQRARGHIRSSLKAGYITKPSRCSRCGCEPAPAKDGRSRLQGHHPDHDKHLQVEWLCVLCHRAETPSNPRRGTESRQAKLTDDDVRDIRASAEPQRRLAAKYGVDQTLISQIKRRKGWAHVQ